MLLGWASCENVSSTPSGVSVTTGVVARGCVAHLGRGVALDMFLGCNSGAVVVWGDVQYSGSLRCLFKDDVDKEVGILWPESLAVTDKNWVSLGVCVEVKGIVTLAFSLM